MGGAERTERRRRQQEAAAQAAAQARRQRKEQPAGEQKPAAPVDRARVKKVALIVVGAAVAVAVVIGFLVWTNASKNATEGQVIAAKSASVRVDEQREGAVVVVGSPKAKATIDIYADFLCPACGQFEERWGKPVRDAVQAGDLRVRQHMVPLLVEASDPAGYSRDAANAALCAADEGRFTAFHDSLFAAQPGEGNRGWDKGQLTRLGRDLGLGGGEFAECVASKRYHSEINAAFDAATKEIKDFVTPTVMGPAGKIDTAKSGWLDAVLGSGS